MSLLTEMDGIEELNGVIVLAATNRPDVIVSGSLQVLAEHDCQLRSLPGSGIDAARSARPHLVRLAARL